MRHAQHPRTPALDGTEIIAQKVIVAMDGITEAKALKLAKLFSSSVWGYKINDLLFTDAKIIRKLKKFGDVFADAKLHDIPNTVANSVARLSRAGADIITIHATGGIPMMKTAKAHAGASKIFAVTVLTSEAHARSVARLVRDAMKAGVDGIVCSGHDLRIVNRIPGARRLLKMVPGIRPADYKKNDDQVRIVTPAQAIQRGADFLVIGRPITQSKDPLNVLKSLLP
ncbi:MAG TPA: orotidine-5'-phosphate decarboxylase [Candidatus Paceibacterota bacterium]|nr:orotidine-5'-phosphate decarboxylase [Candidatus Paceibacterota bacterium]